MNELAALLSMVAALSIGVVRRRCQGGHVRAARPLRDGAALYFAKAIDRMVVVSQLVGVSCT